MVRLLIVDDEVNIRQVVCEYARLNDYEIDEAEKLPLEERRQRNRIYDGYFK